MMTLSVHLDCNKSLFPHEQTTTNQGKHNENGRIHQHCPNWQKRPDNTTQDNTAQDNAAFGA